MTFLIVLKWSADNRWLNICSTTHLNCFSTHFLWFRSYARARRARNSRVFFLLYHITQWPASQCMAYMAHMYIQRGPKWMNLIALFRDTRSLTCQLYFSPSFSITVKLIDELVLFIVYQPSTLTAHTHTYTVATHHTRTFNNFPARFCALSRLSSIARRSK